VIVDETCDSRPLLTKTSNHLLDPEIPKVPWFTTKCINLHPEYIIVHVDKLEELFKFTFSNPNPSMTESLYSVIVTVFEANEMTRKKTIKLSANSLKFEADQWNYTPMRPLNSAARGLQNLESTFYMNNF